MAFEETHSPEIKTGTKPTQAILKKIAYTPTDELLQVAEADFFKALTDKDYMRIAVYMAEKSYKEGGCPIGGLVVEDETGLIWGKGHNTLVQDDDPYCHGETAAIRDAGRKNFRLATLFTTLTPCDICTSLTYMRQFNRLIIGNSLGGENTENEERLVAKGVNVEFLDDILGIELYKKYCEEKPGQNLEDWQGLGARIEKYGHEHP